MNVINLKWKFVSLSVLYSILSICIHILVLLCRYVNIKRFTFMGFIRIFENNFARSVSKFNLRGRQRIFNCK